MFIHHISQVVIQTLENLVVTGGYYIVFIIAAVESFPLIGSVIPGHTIVILSGFLSKLGLLNIWYLFPVVIFGAALGDVLAFYAGKKYGYRFLNKYGSYFLIKDSHIEKAKEIVAAHTGKALVFGRFTPVTRALMPFVVGASHVHIRKFWAYDMLGCMLWAVSSVLIGYVFGASYEVAAGYLGKIFILAIIVSILMIWGYRYVNNRRHIFRLYELHILILNLIGLYVFAKMLQDASSASSFLTQFDVWLNALMEKGTSNYVSFFVLVSNILSPYCLGMIAIIYGFYTLSKERYRYTVLIFLSSVLGLVITPLFKEIIGRTRPDNALFVLSDYSFPSGHAAYVVIFFFCFAYIFSKKIKKEIYRELFIVLCVFAVFISGFSRIYLNVHWFTDVVAGYALGLFIVSGVALLVRYVSASHIFRLMNIHDRK